jgi:hypothetical protein
MKTLAKFLFATMIVSLMIGCGAPLFACAMVIGLIMAA